MHMRSRSDELKKRIYEYVNERKREGFHPSLSEIGSQFGYDKSTIYRYLMEMKEDGMIHYSDGIIDTKESNNETLNLAPALIVASIPCGEAQSEEQYVEAYDQYGESYDRGFVKE